jgi:hypothetical protein
MAVAGWETALGGLLLPWIVVLLGQVLEVELGRVGWAFFVIIPGLGLLGLGLAAAGRLGEVLAIIGGVVTMAGLVLGCRTPPTGSTPGPMPGRWWCWSVPGRALAGGGGTPPRGAGHQRRVADGGRAGRLRGVGGVLRGGGRDRRPARRVGGPLRAGGAADRCPPGPARPSATGRQTTVSSGRVGGGTHGSPSPVHHPHGQVPHRLRSVQLSSPHRLEEGRHVLERAEHAMQSMEDVRRLIREHGWAVLVVGSSGDLRAAHVTCLLDPVHDAGGAGEQPVIIGHGTGGSRRLGAALRASGAARLPGPQRVHLTRLVRRGSIPADLEVHRRARPRDPRGPRRRGGVLGPRPHGRALRGRPGRPVGAARGRAGIRTADRTRDGFLSVRSAAIRPRRS